jgi:hypothetical protein
MMKLLCASLFALLTGCAPPIASQSTTTVGNGYELEKLFSQDGCTVYRFYDHSYYRYWTSCPGNISAHGTCGKSCEHDEDVGTQ